MTINVYWACLEEEWMRSRGPQPVAKKYYSDFFVDDNNDMAAINRCPAVNDYLKNLYYIKSLYKYEFYLEDSAVKSNYFTEKFFDDHVVIRSLEEKMFSFTQKYIFFTDSNSLHMSLYETPIFENNNITKNCHLIPGKYDIGKWYVNTEFPFYLKKDFDKFTVDCDEVIYYLRFHTEEKINFIQYKMNDKLYKYLSDTRSFSKNTGRIKYSMTDFYKGFKLKKFIISEIKNNII
jgi:hypothetical protein